MHQCEEFRERITEHIIDREEVSAELRKELQTCSGCSEFYAESREMMEALSAVDLSVTAAQWNGIEQRLHANIRNSGDRHRIAEHNSVSVPRIPRRNIAPILIPIAALIVLTLTLSRFQRPVVVPAASGTVYVERSVPLDPVTVDFLEESELLLRNVMKIEPANTEDLEEAKKAADEHLAELEQRKQAAAEVPPVVSVMETYETVLRDIRNVDERNANEDITDIQKRIQQNALIANMKAFQPRLTEVGVGIR